MMDNANEVPVLYTTEMKVKLITKGTAPLMLDKVGATFMKLNAAHQKLISQNLMISPALIANIKTGCNSVLFDEWTINFKSDIGKYRCVISVDGEDLSYSLKQGNRYYCNSKGTQIKGVTKEQCANAIAELFLKAFYTEKG